MRSYRAPKRITVPGALPVGLAAVLVATSALAQGTGAPLPELTERNPVRVRLVANVDTAGRDEPFYIGAYFEIMSDWHIYWTFPGNTGQPTRVAFELDERHGMIAAPTFPAPKAYEVDNPEALSFGYGGSLLVPAETVVYDSEAATVEIRAAVSWLACKHLCVKGKAKPELRLPVADQAKPSEWKARFERTVARLPAPLDSERAWLESLVYEHGRYEARFVVTGFSEVVRFVPRWMFGGFCKIVDFGKERDAQGRFVARLSLVGESCLPGAGGVVIGRSAGAPAGGQPEVFAVHAYGPPDQEAAVEPDARVAVSGSESGPEPSTPAIPTPRASDSILLLLLFALLGGLLLNVMPCVIPVVVPKLLGVVRTAEKADDPAAKRRLLTISGIAYFAGVEATMMALGTTVVVLKHLGHEVGWGFQFQNPWFLAFMISLLVVLALGMLEVFSLKSSQHQDQMSWLAKLFYQDPVLGSFLTGLLVTFLGTPCTAPMLGPALGYAFTASSIEILAFLLTVGAGLALPFLLLGVWTGWTRILPRKVSERYDRAMRGLAFLLFATAVWLLSVLGDAYSATAAVNMIWFVTVLAFAGWLFGRLTGSTDPLRRRLIVLAPIAVAVILFGIWVLEFPDANQARAATLRSGIITWDAFSNARLAEVRAEGKTVFVDFTADWCMNCKANEKLVIEKEATKAILDELGVATLKADHTRFNPEIHTWLKRHHRAGVPMYLLFPACQPDEGAVLLPEILTSSLLHGALVQAGPSREGCETR